MYIIQMLSVAHKSRPFLSVVWHPLNVIRSSCVCTVC